MLPYNIKAKKNYMNASIDSYVKFLAHTNLQRTAKKKNILFTSLYLTTHQHHQRKSFVKQIKDTCFLLL